MKKFILFFSTLFFIVLPQVSASDSDKLPIIVDFRSSVSVTSIMPKMIENLNKSTTSSMCETGDTIYSCLERYIQAYEDAGFKFVITFPSYSYDYVDNLSIGGFQIYVFDMNRTSSDLRMTTYSSGGYLYYLISSGLYGWKVSQNGPISVDNINSFMNTYDSESRQISFFTFDINELYDINTSGSVYYSNLEFEFNFSEGYDITFYSDFFNEPVIVNNFLGYQFDRYFYIRNYFNGDTFLPEEPSPDDPDNPNQGIEDGLGDINDSINSSDTSGAQDSFGGFFDNFEDNDYGLSDIIKTPLTFIQGLSTNTCTPITLPLPFVDQNLVLPCIKPIFQEHFSPLLTVYQLITFGIISYFIVINIFKTVRGFKNPDSNNVEVLEL